MTFDRLYHLVTRLANIGWCRYWKLYNYPTDTEFAIQVKDAAGVPAYLGFLEDEPDFIRTDYKNIYVFRKEPEKP